MDFFKVNFVNKTGTYHKEEEEEQAHFCLLAEEI